jgi:hypothetical protein
MMMTSKHAIELKDSHLDQLTKTVTLTKKSRRFF